MQPNWLIFAAVGALIGYLIPYFVKFISFTIRRLKRNIIKGDWFVYHPTNRENEFIIESSKFNIRSGYYNPYVIREYKNNSQLFAKGALTFERNYLLIRLNTVAHEEKVYIRLYSPIGTADNIAWGFFQSIDYLGKPISGPIVFSRDEMSSDEVRNYISKKVEVVQDMKLITSVY